MSKRKRGLDSHELSLLSFFSVTLILIKNSKKKRKMMKEEEEDEEEEMVAVLMETKTQDARRNF